MSAVDSIIATKGDLQERAISESLRELLETREPLLASFVDWASGGRWRVARPVELVAIKTEQSVRERTGHSRRPDLQIEFRDVTGRMRTIRSEHKWKAMTDPNQLGSYTALPDVASSDRCLCFIARHSDDAMIASFHCDRADTWASIANRFKAVCGSDSMVGDWADAIVSRAPGGPRRQIKPAMLGQLWDAVQLFDKDARLTQLVPRAVWDSRICLPPAWDRTAMYLGLRNNEPFSVRNCRCVYVGFRFHEQNLGVKLQGNHDCDLILAIHSNPKHSRFADLLVQNAARKLASLPFGVRPTALAPPLTTHGGWHQLAACSALRIEPGLLPDAQSLAGLAIPILCSWLTTLGPVLDDLGD